MTTKNLNVERVSYVSKKPFREVLEALGAGIGHPNMEELWKRIWNANTVTEVEGIMRSVVGASGLIEFLSFDHGAVVFKGKPGRAPGIVRLVIGNPAIMRQMAEHVPDAGSYAPVTILVDERSDGTHVSYDRMASFLEAYRNEDALRIARDLDAKVEKLLASATK
jgi:uncharacterized protein (DUF302 family)